jgi:hypothetical protein
LTAQEEPINTVKQYKFLDVTINNNLRFKEHVDNVTKKATKRTNILKFLAGKDWGQALESQRKMYLTYVRSGIEYASSSWWPWIAKNRQATTGAGAECGA